MTDAQCQHNVGLLNKPFTVEQLSKSLNDLMTAR